MPDTELQGKVNEGFTESQDKISVAVDDVQPPPPDYESLPIPTQNKTRKLSIEGGGSGYGRTVIHVADAQKTYGTGSKARVVLQSLCMAVEEHTIYGLLGASGCGKTTLLSCIVALRKLDSGTILVCGHPTGTRESGIPGKRVGYMPQEVALNGECTIQEVLLYFGRIYGMSRSNIDRRHSYLVKLLSLEGLDQSIENLSEGQKRRVSMAVALLHEPEILILDEPTVGCDPLLRDSIWKYLNDLVKKKAATVIVTTHYIEEMRQADRIGIMRSGHLLCENSPSNLLRIYNENLLDTVVVKLCQKDAKQAGDTDEEAGSRARARTLSDSTRARPTPRPSIVGGLDLPLESIARSRGIRRNSTAQEIEAEWRWRPTGDKDRPHKSTPSVFNRLHGLIVKNVLVVLRNPLFTICLFCIPALTVLVFCVAIGGDPSGLKVGLVNKETTHCLTNYTQRLGTGPPIGGCVEPVDLSCEYLYALDRDSIDLIQVDTVEEATKRTADAKLWGFLTFGPDFSKSFFKRMVEGDSGNETISGSRIDIRLDMTGATNGLILQKKFIDGFRKMTGILLLSCGIDAVGKDLPIAFGEPIHGTADQEVMEFMGLGVGFGIIFFMCALQCGLTYIVEKKDGMLNRTLVAGVSRIDIMLSHFIVQLSIVALVQIIVTAVIMYILFEIPLRGSLALASTLLVINCVSGMSLGFMLATFCSDEKYAMLMAIGTVFPNFLVAGLIWPIEGLPLVMQAFSFVLPCTLTGEAFRSISLRGFDITHPNVYSGFLSACIWTSIYWLVIILWHRYGQRKQ